jgi:hypothetical protein
MTAAYQESRKRGRDDSDEDYSTGGVMMDIVPKVELPYAANR